MGCAETGSGKTAAFLFPIIDNILKAEKNKTGPEEYLQHGEANYENKWICHPKVVILAPTRELVIQIAKEANNYTARTPIKGSVLIN